MCAIENYTPQMEQDVVVIRYYLSLRPSISLYIGGLLWPCWHLRTWIATRSACPT